VDYSKSLNNYGVYETRTRGLNLSSVVVPDTVTSIGFRAFITGFQKGFFQSENYATGFSVSLPANIAGLGKEPGRGYVEPLGKFYDKNGKKAGTYIWDGENWRYEAKR
jgi:hypothetical protein